MEACRVGWRKALGYDMQRRRYWALGANTGAWRVYVEEQEGSLWGWYEGAQSSFFCLCISCCCLSDVVHLGSLCSVICAFFQKLLICFVHLCSDASVFSKLGTGNTRRMQGQIMKDGGLAFCFDFLLGTQQRRLGIAAAIEFPLSCNQS